jgi:hypothetical protein
VRHQPFPLPLPVWFGDVGPTGRSAIIRIPTAGATPPLQDMAAGLTLW